MSSFSLKNVVFYIQILVNRTLNSPGFVGRLQVLTALSQSPSFYRRLAEINRSLAAISLVFWHLIRFFHDLFEKFLDLCWNFSSNVLIELHMHVIVQNGVEVNAQQ